MVCLACKVMFRMLTSKLGLKSHTPMARCYVKDRQLTSNADLELHHTRRVALMWLLMMFASHAAVKGMFMPARMLLSYIMFIGH
jgi:hypothetical protein